MYNTPILFLIFNRLDTTEKVFNQIRKIQPHQLFIASDGPRTYKTQEKKICQQVRKFVLENIDWQCEVHTLFRDNNLGCGKAVSEAITWFFEHVTEGIILEDDCLPHNDFFYYCKTLLEKYRYEEVIKVICGTNSVGMNKIGSNSYFYFPYSFVWGWATWRRTWNEYKFDINTISENKFLHDLKTTVNNNKQLVTYYAGICNQMQAGNVDTWDYQLLFTLLVHGGLAVVPNTNLVTNIGGYYGTHISENPSEDKNIDRSTSSILPLTYPSKIQALTSRENEINFLKILDIKKESVLQKALKLCNKIIRKIYRILVALVK